MNHSRIFCNFEEATDEGRLKSYKKSIKYQCFDLDDEIEKKDGRNNQRICTMMGEQWISE